MNTLKGQIKSIATHEQLSMVGIDICGVNFQSIVIETHESASYLRVGKQILVKFKETEVILSELNNHAIGISNRCIAKVINIEKGELLVKVGLETTGGPINAILNRDDAKSLKLSLNSDILVLVQSTEIMLSE